MGSRMTQPGNGLRGGLLAAGSDIAVSHSGGQGRRLSRGPGPILIGPVTTLEGEAGKCDLTDPGPCPSPPLPRRLPSFLPPAARAAAAAAALPARATPSRS